MAIKDIWWADNSFKTDFHFLWQPLGKSINTVTLKGNLKVKLEGELSSRKDSDRTDITLSFEFFFNDLSHSFNLSGDSTTGQLTIEDKPAVSIVDGRTGKSVDLEIQHVLIRGTVVETATGDTKTIDKHVYIHDALTKAWITPNQLTIRKDKPEYHLTILGQFSDGMVGDLTYSMCETSMGTFKEVLWQPTPHLESHGKLLTKDIPLSGIKAKAKLPLSLGEFITPEIEILQGDNWKDLPPEATIVPTSPAAGLTEKEDIEAAVHQNPNVLFVPDGFETADKGKFEQIVNGIVQRLNRSHYFKPFSWLKGSINYWWAFAPSPQAGVNILYPVVPETISGGKMMGDRLLIHNDGANWIDLEIEKLIQLVGYPIHDKYKAPYTKAEFDEHIFKWIQMYSPHHATLALDLHHTSYERVYKKWRSLSDFRLLDEVDNLMGTSYGKFNRNYKYRSTEMYWRRSSRYYFNKWFKNLVDKRDPSISLGKNWINTGADGYGKDYDYIIILSAGGDKGGARHNVSSSNRNSDYTVLSVSADQFKLSLKESSSPSTDRQTQLDPLPVPTSAGLALSSLFVHEFGHSLHLYDEYGGAKKVGGSILDKTHWRNTQEKSNVEYAGALSGNRVKWRWPRIIAAGVLNGDIWSKDGLGPDDPSDPLPTYHLIPLQPGHGKYFKKGDVVHLRSRDLMTTKIHDYNVESHDDTHSGMLSIVEDIDSNSDRDLVTVIGKNVAFTGSKLGEGAILYKGKPASEKTQKAADAAYETYPYFELLPFDIKEDITISGLPSEDCSKKQVSKPQSPSNLPSGLPRRPPLLPTGKPFFPAWIVGLYEGGGGSFCDIYHPTGICTMRNSNSVPNTVNVQYSFCPVCKYAIVDLLGPTRHKEADELYNLYYMQS